MNMIDKALRELFDGLDNVDAVLESKQSVSRVTRARGVRARGGRVKLSVDECKALCQSIGLTYKDGYENRVVERVFTDETVDRYGDIVSAEGVDLKRYRENPVVLVFHNSQAFPVGSCIKVWYDPEKRNVTGWILFYDETIDSSGLSERAFQYCVSGALKTVSIGFLPKSREDVYRPTDEERKQWKMPPFGVKYLKTELLEVSITPVPANPNAKDMSTEVKRGLFDLKSLTQAIKDKVFSKDILDIAESILLNELEANTKWTVDADITACSGYPDAMSFALTTEEIEREVALCERPNDHACRFADSNGKGYIGFRQCTRKDKEKEYTVIFCQTDQNHWEEFAYYYPKATWLAPEAEEHSLLFGGVFEKAEDTIDQLHDQIRNVAGSPLTLDKESKELVHLLINKLIILSERVDLLSRSVELLASETARATKAYSRHVSSGGQSGEIDLETLSDDMLANQIVDEVVRATKVK